MERTSVDASCACSSAWLTCVPRAATLQLYCTSLSQHLVWRGLKLSRVVNVTCKRNFHPIVCAFLATLEQKNSIILHIVPIEGALGVSEDEMPRIAILSECVVE